MQTLQTIAQILIVAALVAFVAVTWYHAIFGTEPDERNQNIRQQQAEEILNQ